MSLSDALYKRQNVVTPDVSGRKTIVMAFIVFEGLDASGKSTLIGKFKDYLHKKGISSVILRDPGTTLLGEKIRNIILDIHGEVPCPRAEVLLYEAARVQMVEKKYFACPG